MTFVPVFGSSIGEIFQPFLKAMAWLLAFFYAIIPNYAVAIALLTIFVMAVTAPLTIKSNRSMVAMQRLQPELKKIQAKYKGDRVQLNEEMMKLYRENNVSPAGGCLPMLVSAPVFIMLYSVIKGLTHTVTHGSTVVAEPLYVGHSTKLYQNLVAHPGQMKAFGINLADTLFSHQSSFWGHVPFAVLIIAAIVLQYLQMRLMNTRNQAASQLNPQMQAMQKYMPLIFAVIYIRISAGVNIYFIVSALCRIGLQEWGFRSGMYDKPPKARRGMLGGAGGAGTGGSGGRRTLMDRLADAQKQALAQQEEARRARELPPGDAAPTEDRPVGRSGGSAGKGSRSPSGAGSGSGKAAPGGSAKAGGKAASPAGDGADAGGGGVNGRANGNANGNGVAKGPSAAGGNRGKGGGSGASGTRRNGANGTGKESDEEGQGGGPGSGASASRSKSKRPRRPR